MGVKNTKIHDKNKPWSVNNCKVVRGHIKIPALFLFWLKDILDHKKSPHHRHLRHVHDLGDAPLNNN